MDLTPPYHNADPAVESLGMPTGLKTSSPVCLQTSMVKSWRLRSASRWPLSRRSVYSHVVNPTEDSRGPFVDVVHYPGNMLCHLCGKSGDTRTVADVVLTVSRINSSLHSYYQFCHTHYRKEMVYLRTKVFNPLPKSPDSLTDYLPVQYWTTILIIVFGVSLFLVCRKYSRSISPERRAANTIQQ